jgi:dTMP kinase
MTERGLGRFITFEGGEGTGKTTQIEALTAALTNQAFEVHQTREPGGCPEAEVIREILVTGEPGRWKPTTEALLHFAARNEHLERVVRPKLQQGAWVVSDRFSDSTMAYQGLVQGLGKEVVDGLNALVVGQTQPDLTLILDLESEEGLTRAGARAGNENRYERMGDAFHVKLREAFLEIAKENPDRCALIDASGTVEDVAARIWNVVSTRLNLK